MIHTDVVCRSSTTFLLRSTPLLPIAGDRARYGNWRGNKNNITIIVVVTSGVFLHRPIPPVPDALFFFFFFIEPGRVDNTVATTTFAPRAHDLENKFNIATPPPPPPVCCTRVCTSRARAVQRTRALCVSPCASSPISGNTFMPVRELLGKHAPDSLRDPCRLLRRRRYQKTVKSESHGPCEMSGTNFRVNRSGRR